MPIPADRDFSAAGGRWYLRRVGGRRRSLPAVLECISIQAGTGVKLRHSPSSLRHSASYSAAISIRGSFWRRNRRSCAEVSRAILLRSAADRRKTASTQISTTSRNSL